MVPGPLINHAEPNGAFLASQSTNSFGGGFEQQLGFSVDRVAVGAVTTAVEDQAGLGQAPGDIFTTTNAFAAPIMFVGTLGQGWYPGESGTFSGFLGAGGPLPSNRIRFDDYDFGLLTGSAVNGPTVSVAAPSTGTPGSHDNIDSFDFVPADLGVPDSIFDSNLYFSVYPDQAINAGGISSASIFVAGVGHASTTATPYATVKGDG